MAEDEEPKSPAEELGILLGTFTPEVQEAVRTKCAELKLDTSRGTVSLDESLHNLSHIRDVLRDAIQGKKVEQIPISIQRTLIELCESVSENIAAINSGKDQIEGLTEAIENLYARIWRLGFERMSDQFLGYEAKLNALKHLEAQAHKTSGELAGGIALRDELQELLDQTKKNQEQAAAQAASAQEDSEGAKITLEAIQKSQADATAKLATIVEALSTAEKSLSDTKAKNVEVTALSKAISTFHESIDENKEKLEGVVAQAGNTVKESNEKTSKLLDELAALEGQIKEQMEKATGFSLFLSFQKRKEALSWSRRVWMAGVYFVLILVAGLTSWLGWEYSKAGSVLNAGFWLKLSAYPPLAYLIYFCTKNYGHERRLEEEYAFKSNISISLVPYKELVEKTNPKEEKYSDFLIQTINNVFSSPTDKVFGSHDGSEGRGPKPKAIKDALQTIREVAQVARALK